MDGDVLALAVFDDGSGPAVYAGGEFRTVGDRTVDFIAKWNGAEWTPLDAPGGSGVSWHVVALKVFDDGAGPALYAGGRFSNAGGRPISYLAKWNGEDWSPVFGPGGGGVDFAVNAMAVRNAGMGPALVAGGSFSIADGQQVYFVAEWDGHAWNPLGDPPGLGQGPTSVSSLALLDRSDGSIVYAGGRFPTIFTRSTRIPANGIAQFDGSEWSTLSGPSETGVSNAVEDLTIFDDGSGPALFAGGTFPEAGGVTVNQVAKWDGTEWSPLSGPTGAGVDQRVRALTVFDDGDGPALYVGGEFTSAGGVSARGIAKWDGTEWSPVSTPGGPGVSLIDVRTLKVMDDGTGPALYAAGRFSLDGGQSTIRSVARWDCDASFCIADTNNDGVVDADDFFLFLQWFADSDPRADLNKDGVIDADDFFLYQTLFAQGC